MAIYLAVFVLQRFGEDFEIDEDLMDEEEEDDFGQDLEFGAFDNEDGDVRITRSDADDAPAEAEADAEAPAEEAEAASEDG